MILLPTSSSEIQAIISNLKQDSSPGSDDIPPSVIKCAVSSIASHLSYLINLTMSKGFFPTALKTAKVVPILKSGDSRSISNYRPISLLPIFSKIYERAIANRLNSFINSNNILYDRQFGFRKAHSTDMALMALVEDISSAIDEKLWVSSVFIDLSKAFDTLDHSILLGKLQHLGIRGVSLDLFVSYLTNRSQCVQFGGVKSDMLPITCGVPQ
jgi:hypothetical protein